MYTNWRWKFLSQNNPVLIRSMRRFNIWVKKGFSNHFPNSSVASRKETAFPLFSWVHVTFSNMFLHIIVACTCDIMHPTPSWWCHFATTFPRILNIFFPVWSHVSAVEFCASNSRTIYAHTLPPKILEYCQHLTHALTNSPKHGNIKQSKES